MDRKEFIKACGFACAGSIGLAAILQSCAVSKTSTGNIIGSDLLVALSDFETKAGSNIYHKKYILISNKELRFPVCVYRHDAENYSALWLQCPHQGAELQVFGDKLQCPAHGSEFDNKGHVSGGPASSSLRTFPVTIENDQLKISLKAL
jgi:nitrite reductase/ring-hydroxylating ferredoxin subunit